jgi:phosphatidylserine/phosphatidylglycerophosphate/cardiolipin synthase-like enzyme
MRMRKIELHATLDAELVDIFGEHLEACRRRAWIAVYVLTLPYVITQLIRLHRAGADVKVILSNDPANDGTISFLRANNVPVKVWRQTHGILHMKLALLDDHAILMSANLTHYGLNRNQELMLVIKDREIVSKLEKIFLGYWRTA